MFWIGLLACLLPRRYRKWWEEERSSSLVEGSVQFVVCVALIFLRLIHGLQPQAMPSALALSAAEQSGRTGLMAMGAVTGLAVLLHPWTLVLAWFALEGYVRLLAAIVTGECVSTLPAYLVERVHAAVERPRRKDPRISLTAR